MSSAPNSTGFPQPASEFSISFGVISASVRMIIHRDISPAPLSFVLLPVTRFDCPKTMLSSLKPWCDLQWRDVKVFQLDGTVAIEKQVLFLNIFLP